MTQNTYRRFIKVNGVTIGSPVFASKKEADEWYEARKSERAKIKEGRRAGYVPTFLEYSAKWVRQLVQDYDRPTWSGYESNVRLHLLPDLKDMKMHKITRAHCRDVLMNVTRNGYSTNHRKHVQATLSKIFTDAMNEDPPLRDDNPVYRMKFDGRRQSTKYIPATLESEDEVALFLEAAKRVSDTHFVMCCLGLMAALRKGELIALKWKHVKWRSNEIKIQSRYRAAMREIAAGTKSGESSVRVVPVSNLLISVLEAFREKSQFNSDEDFILARPDGKHFQAEPFQKMFDRIRIEANRPDLTLHSLRHTYGRLFAAKTGNTKALQAILGHTSAATTAIYSELAASQVSPFGRQMDYGIRVTGGASDTIKTHSRTRSLRKSTR